MRRDPLPHTVILGDIENYSPGGFRRHLSFQDGLHDILEEATERSRLRRMDWVRQGTGDGELALVPADIPKYYVVSDFLYYLGVALGEYNRDKAEGHRIRLRLAVDWGDVVVNGQNFAGNAPIRVARLSDCGEFKRALAESTTSDLALIVSNPFFEEVVRDGAPGVDPSTYRRIRVEHPQKGFSEDAWIHLPGGSAPETGTNPLVPETAPEPAASEPPPEPAAQPGGATYVFHDKVDNSGAAAFGPGATATQTNHAGTSTELRPPGRHP